MNMVGSVRRSPWISRHALLALLGLIVVNSAVAQEPPPTAANPAPASGDTISAPEAPPTPPTAAVDVTAELVALRAEVDSLKEKQADADAAALLSQGDDSVTRTAETELLHIYGFMDFGMDKPFVNKHDAIGLLRPTVANTFVFGNLNLYFEAEPVEHLRTMVELRFTLAPNGEETQLGPPIGTSYQRIDTTAFDFSSPSSQSQLRLGGIYIERAWSEYEFSDLFKVQWGLFLNPFGIWNLDHGSPTLISLMLPTFIASQMVPTRLLGVHVHGSAFFGSTEIGYAVHISNGRTPLDFDLSEQKAVGARLYVAQDGDFGRLVFGASGYWGSYLDQEKAVTPITANSASVNWIDTVHYNEQLLGFDVALDVENLRVRAEAVFRWVNYKDGKSEQIFTGDGSQQYLPNRLEYNSYVMAAYRTPWRIEPYLEGEVSSKSYTLPLWSGSARASSSDIAALYLSAGFNIELTTHTLFKTQFVWDRAYDRNFRHQSVDFPILFIRVVDSF